MLLVGVCCCLLFVVACCLLLFVVAWCCLLLFVVGPHGLLLRLLHVCIVFVCLVFDCEDCFVSGTRADQGPTRYHGTTMGPQASRSLDSYSALLSVGNKF